MFRRNRNAAPHAAADDTAVEARGLRKVYRTGAIVVEALRGIDLRIERGELVAIVGPSGCGKTTLLNCLAGLEHAFEGDVLLAGQSLRALSDNRRALLRAEATGFIFQSFNLLPTLSALENVEMPLLIAGSTGGEVRRRALEMLDAVGLAERAHHRPAALSGGQQQRVAIARALVNRPAIIWADEPTGNLDSESSAEIIELVKRLNRENRQTFVIVTHAADIAAHTRRLIRMRDGQIVVDQAITELAPPIGQRDPRAVS
ncbi:MAG: ABC transporter ATP-binding protein [Chloroflexi bacterium]|nr:ABC transporter ATP-binding protein [Chloroflexota bacterium]